MSRVYGHAHASARYRQIRNLQDLARFVGQLELLIGPTLITAIRAGKWQYVERDRSRELLRCRQRERIAAACKARRLPRNRVDLSFQLLDPGNTTSRHSLIGRGHEPYQSCFDVQRFQYRHRRHGGAIRVGDDALGNGIERVRIDLAHY